MFAKECAGTRGERWGRRRLAICAATNGSHMRATGSIKAPKPSTRRLAGELRRAIVAAGAVLGVCTMGAFFAGWGQSQANRSPQSNRESAADLRNGSVLVVSP